MGRQRTGGGDFYGVRSGKTVARIVGSSSGLMLQQMVNSHGRK
ncbi:hypothetical protein LINGRAHAP2_LOCUS14623 [Linum grandiflorum]